MNRIEEIYYEAKSDKYFKRFAAHRPDVTKGNAVYSVSLLIYTRTPEL